MKSEPGYNLHFRLVLDSLIHETEVSVIGHCKRDIIIKEVEFSFFFLPFLRFSFSLVFFPFPLT
jgi:hypothetical protein